jgi:hypothetical protein
VPYADFGDPQSLNLYGFVGGNPASKADPDGHFQQAFLPLAPTTPPPLRAEAKDLGHALANLAVHMLNFAGKAAPGSQILDAIGAMPQIKTPYPNAGPKAQALEVTMGLALPALGEIRGLAATAEVIDLTAQARLPSILAGRAEEVHAVLEPIAQDMRTTAALATKEGPTVVGSGVRDLSPAQRAALTPGEIAAKAPGEHAEITVLKGAAENGLTPRSMATTRDMCPSCQAAVEKSGGTVTGPRTAEWK